MSRAAVPARWATVAALVAALACGASAAAATPGDAERLGRVIVNGLPATGIVADLPAVGDGPAIRRYHDSGHFGADRALVAEAARARLDEIVETRCPEGPVQCRDLRLALVIDIDDTVLDWYPSFARYGFDLPASARQARVASCATPVIAPVRSLVRDAQARGVAVLVVSGRRDTVRSATRACLTRRGMSGWQALVLRRPDQDGLDASDYKGQAMRELLESGWQPVLSIGDQPGDIAAGWGIARFLLPNPLYAAT